MASKEDEGEGKAACEGKVSDEDIFAKVQAFMMSDGLEREFEAFAAKHHEVFMDAIDKTQDDEHNHEYFEVYQQYLTEFEGKIQDFIRSEGGDLSDFRLAAERALKEADEDNPRRFFIEALLATTEYGVFLSLMRGEARKFQGK